MVFAMPAQARISAVRLRVRDLAASLGFWRDLLGLEVISRSGDETVLAPSGNRFRLVLVSDPAAVRRPLRTTGLYHVALLLPDRPALAALVRRLMEAHYDGFEGASDHGVSEAFYLHDPEGNGVELYRDRPRGDWPMGNGSVAMFTDALDIEGLLSAAGKSAPCHPDTRIGHIHLHVPDLPEAERFYAGTLGLAVTQRGYRGALFFSTGGYHHHIAANVWAGKGRAPSGAAGLVDYTWSLPADGIEALREQIPGGPAHPDPSGASLSLLDPSGARVHLVSGSAGSPPVV